MLTYIFLKFFQIRVNWKLEWFRQWLSHNLSHNENRTIYRFCIWISEKNRDFLSIFSEFIKCKDMVFFYSSCYFQVKCWLQTFRRGIPFEWIPKILSEFKDLLLRKRKIIEINIVVFKINLMFCCQSTDRYFNALYFFIFEERSHLDKI